MSSSTRTVVDRVLAFFTNDYHVVSSTFANVSVGIRVLMGCSDETADAFVREFTQTSASGGKYINTHQLAEKLVRILEEREGR